MVTRGSEAKHTQTLPLRHSWPRRAAGHISGHSRYIVVSVVLEVAQVTEGVQRKGPWPGRGWQGGLPREGEA
jgi:hypothetical protein